MNWYPWLNGPYRQLIGQYQHGRDHHALLLHAAYGMGEDALVYGLSRWLLCQHRDGDKSCGKCHSCHLMIAGNHPDWHVLAPEKGKNTLGVEPIRQLIETLYNYSQQGGAKVIWLAHAEQLTEAAANALLKTLEEPPAKTYFIIGCREPSQLLATLRSRCFYWHLPAPDEAPTAQWISRQLPAEPAAITTALRLSAGAPLAALNLLQPESWQQRQSLFAHLAQGWQQGDLLSLLASLNHEDVAERLQWLCSLLLDAMKWQQGAGQYVINHDQHALIAQLANTVPNTLLQEEMQQWVNCRQQLVTVVGVNRELLLTERLLESEQRFSGAA
ncbi:DNA polymerase III subunit delta' [Rouxiella sp. Mn2063]|uniref:DNA polymerase III subunit delta' n=1 Tax=Rouxiella sp. Mn2063 TaxID=3395262 RepID=UPI003BE4C18C